MNSIEAIKILGYEQKEDGWHRDDGLVTWRVENENVIAALNTLSATESERNELDRAVSSLCDELDWYHDRLDEARAMVCDLFVQACQVSFDHEKQEGTYDHMAISTYEDAQAALIEWGMIRPDQCKGDHR